MTEAEEKDPTEEIKVDLPEQMNKVPCLPEGDREEAVAGKRIVETGFSTPPEAMPGRGFFDGLVVVTLIVFLVFTLLITIGAMAIPSIREW